jgi:hypothetical protein
MTTSAPVRPIPADVSETHARYRCLHRRWQWLSALGWFCWAGAGTAAFLLLLPVGQFVRALGWVGILCAAAILQAALGSYVRRYQIARNAVADLIEHYRTNPDLDDTRLLEACRGIAGFQRIHRCRSVPAWARVTLQRCWARIILWRIPSGVIGVAVLAATPEYFPVGVASVITVANFILLPDYLGPFRRLSAARNRLQNAIERYEFESPGVEDQLRAADHTAREILAHGLSRPPAESR